MKDTAVYRVYIINENTYRPGADGLDAIVNRPTSKQPKVVRMWRLKQLNRWLSKKGISAEGEL